MRLRLLVLVVALLAAACTGSGSESPSESTSGASGDEQGTELAASLCIPLLKPLELGAVTPADVGNDTATSLANLAAIYETVIVMEADATTDQIATVVGRIEDSVAAQLVRAALGQQALDEYSELFDEDRVAAEVSVVLEIRSSADGPADADAFDQLVDGLRSMRGVFSVSDFDRFADVTEPQQVPGVSLYEVLATPWLVPRLNIFVEDDASVDQIAAVRAAVDETGFGYVWIDQTTAFEEYQAMLPANANAGPLTVADMPPSFRLEGVSRVEADALVAEFEAMEAVFDAVVMSPEFDAPLRNLSRELLGRPAAAEQLSAAIAAAPESLQQVLSRLGDLAEDGSSTWTTEAEQRYYADASALRQAGEESCGVDCCIINRVSPLSDLLEDLLFP